MRKIEGNNPPSDRWSALAAQLLKYDEAKDGPHDSEIDTDDAPSTRLEEEIACIDLLHRVWTTETPASAPLPPDKSFTEFTLLREIGRGGMGVVYEAEQLALRRRVALKILPIASALSEGRLARFQNEALAAATLNHPNIVPVYSVGCEHGLHYYAMQLIDGQSLAEQIAKRRKNPQAAETDYFELASLAAQAADALEFSHRKGIVHRDVKPANLLLDDVGKLWVTDFGLARLSDEAGLTSTGDMLGTLRYMSPERIASNYPIVDPSADVYSLGMTLFEMIALRPAFDGQDRAALLRQILEDEPPRLRQVAPNAPVDLETIVAKAIEKDPAQRYPSAAALAADLRRFINREPIAAKPPSVVDRVAKWSQRHRTFVRLAGLFAALLAATWTFNSIRIRHALDETSELLYIADMNLAFEAWKDGWSDAVRTPLDRQIPRDGQVDQRGFEWSLLYGASQKPRVSVLLGHEGAVTEIAVFPDRRRLASVGVDGTLRIWDMPTQSLLRTIEVGDSKLFSVAVSPNGRYVVVGSTAAHLLDLESDAPMKEIFRHDSNIESLAFHRDGEQIAAGIRYHEVCLFSLNGEIIKRIPCDARGYTLEFHPQRPSLLIPNRQDETSEVRSSLIQIWSDDLSAMQSKITNGSRKHGGTLTHARWSPCGKYFVAGEVYQSRIHLYPHNSDRKIDSTPVARHRLSDLAYSPDGSTVAIAYENGILELCPIDANLDDAPSFGHRSQVFKAHNGEVLAVRFVNSKKVVTCGQEGRIRIWSLGGRDTPDFKVTKDHLLEFDVSPDGKNLLFVGDTGYIVADAEHEEVRYQYAHATRKHKLCAWSPRSDRFAVGCKGPNRLLVAGASGRVQKNLPIDDEPHGICFSPDGSTVAVVMDQQLDLWEPHTERKAGQWKLSPKSRCAIFTPDGKTLIVGGHEDGVTFIPMDGRKSTRTIPCKLVDSVALSPDGSLLATGHLDGVIRLWNLDSDAPPVELVAHLRYVRKLAFTRDGRTLISASDDGAIRLWSVAHGRGFGPFVKRARNGSAGAAGMFGLPADNRFLATACETTNPDSPAIDIWNIE
ncbi:WD40 repeat domain-containing serine/threonine-protein kinase [Lacipirellula parvula]|uniref:Protein kinase domain-containing protein n=1 Tax=Lacipirellula parvula TaxID=2650471 RepID=A0A5K7XMX1_9BACT|nr:WD40 repeat domain-containing serine/threonine-protein kinase [Lacipirellula parvula]BBO36063.1 hypothetical protein PLANPX_5675 [Lacipirellula parvula]